MMASKEEYEQMLANLENSEHFLVSSVDAALAAQNAAIAAESMDLGICYIGSIRNNLSQVDELLSLPKHVIPLFGMVTGVPDHQPERKPRLPQKVYILKMSIKNPPRLSNHLMRGLRNIINPDPAITALIPGRIRCYVALLHQ